MNVGLHLSIAGGLAESMERAGRLGCQAVQIFLQNPRGWRWRPVTATEIMAFQEKRRVHEIALAVGHLSYLPNLAAADPELERRSWERLRQELLLGKSLGLDYLVCHPGHAADAEAGLKRLAAGLRELLVEVPPPPLVLLENTAGQKNELGMRLAELAQIISLSRVPLGLCLDTAHAFAAGYNLRLRAGRQSLLREIGDGVGFEALKVIHLNDSLFPCGSRRDRHWHLGRGRIGLPGLGRFLESCAPWAQAIILETPKILPDDDRHNLATARRLLQGDFTRIPTWKLPKPDPGGGRP